MEKEYYRLLLEDDSKFYLELLRDVKSDMIAFRLYCANSGLLVNRGFCFDSNSKPKHALLIMNIDTPIVDEVVLSEEVFNFIIK